MKYLFLDSEIVYNLDNKLKKGEKNEKNNR